MVCVKELLPCSEVLFWLFSEAKHYCLRVLLASQHSKAFSCLLLGSADAMSSINCHNDRYVEQKQTENWVSAFCP